MTSSNLDRIVLLLRVAAAAWVGGTLAMAVVTVLEDVSRPQLLVVFVVAVAAFWVLVVGTFGRGHPVTVNPAAAAPGVPVMAVSPSYAPAPPPLPSPRSRPTQPMPPPAMPRQSMPPPPPAHRWYADAEQDRRVRAAAAGASYPPSTGLDRTAAGGVATQLPPGEPQTTRIQLRTADADEDDPPTQLVQCTRCGDFAVGVRDAAPVFDFDCRRCGHRWSWTVGTSWPLTIIRPI